MPQPPISAATRRALEQLRRQRSDATAVRGRPQPAQPRPQTPRATIGAQRPGTGADQALETIAANDRARAEVKARSFASPVGSMAHLAGAALEPVEWAAAGLQAGAEALDGEYGEAAKTVGGAAIPGAFAGAAGMILRKGDAGRDIIKHGPWHFRTREEAHEIARNGGGGRIRNAGPGAEHILTSDDLKMPRVGAPEQIVRPATRFGGATYTGPMHHDAVDRAMSDAGMNHMDHDAHDALVESGEHGFVTRPSVLRGKHQPLRDIQMPGEDAYLTAAPRTPSEAPLTGRTPRRGEEGWGSSVLGDSVPTLPTSAKKALARARGKAPQLPISPAGSGPASDPLEAAERLYQQRLATVDNYAQSAGERASFLSRAEADVLQARQAASKRGGAQAAAAAAPVAPGAPVPAPAAPAKAAKGGKRARMMAESESIETVTGPAWTEADLGAAPDPKVKPPAQWTPAELESYGRAHGTPGLGVVNAPTPYQLASGREVNIPGGFEGTFSLYDLYTLKAQAINPNEIPDDVHAALQQKFLRTMDNYGEEGMDDPSVFRGLLMGMLSPNNPLTPNEFAVSRLMPRDMDDVSRLARTAPADIITGAGLQAASKGGLGVVGSPDYANVQNLAQMFEQNPKWFRKRPDEPWQQYVERIASQTRGLSVKTGSFGTVWQDLPGADISAIDRHMGDAFLDDILADPAKRTAFEKTLIGEWNKTVPKLNKEAAAKAKKGKGKGTPRVLAKAKSIAEVRAQPGGEGAFKDLVMQYITRHKSPKLDQKIPAKQGGGTRPNPKAPQWARDEQWIDGRRPETIVQTGEDMTRALDVNRARARQTGLSTFGEQWRIWDRKRGRLEPHEVMYPGLNRLPRMDFEHAQAALAAHKQAGYLDNAKNTDGGEAMLPPTRRVRNPMELAYWSLLLSGGGAAAASQQRPAEDRRQRGSY